MSSRATTHHRLATRLGVSLAGQLVAVGVLALAVYGAVAGTRSSPPRDGMLIVKGRLGAPLRPGVLRGLNLRVTNRYDFDLLMTRLTVRASVDAPHRAAGCRPPRDFVVRQVARSAYPIRVPRASAVRLRTLGVRTLPRVGMRYLPAVNQDACQGASLRLRYRARATRDGARRRAAGG